jgi:hypothetical protein
MPVIKIYGFTEETAVATEFREKIATEMVKHFPSGTSATVLIFSSCKTCDEKPESYEYLEILYEKPEQKETITKILIELGVNQEKDIIFIRMEPEHFIPAEE